MLTSVLHLFSMKPHWCHKGDTSSSCFHLFFDLTPSNLNVLVAWVAVGYVNSTPCRWCYYYPPQNAMIHGFLIHQTSPTRNSVCPAWNGAHTSPLQNNLLRGDPHSPLYFFFFLSTEKDNRTMTWPRLVMHHCLRSICLLQVHHLTLNICSRKPLLSF